MQDDWLTDLLPSTLTDPTAAPEAVTHTSPDLTADPLATSHATLTHHSLEPDLTGHLASMPHLDAPSWHDYPRTMYSPSQTASSVTSGGGDSVDPSGNAWDWTVGGLSAPHATFDPAHPGGVVVGDPASAAAHWQPQHMPDSCVSAVQSNMIAEQTGRSLPEMVLYAEAIASGLIQEQGTPAILTPVELQQHGDRPTPMCMGRSRIWKRRWPTGKV